MFTGIIQAVGKVVHSQARGSDLRLSIAAGSLDLGDVQAGDSIAVNGVCLTVINKQTDRFDVDMSAETIRCTSGLALDGAVNLEKALRLADRLGGHLVTGHVDGVGHVVKVKGSVYTFRAPKAVSRYVAPKGSICIDGVSLTVNRVRGADFEVNLIPHTLKVTTLSRLMLGAEVNLEADLVARYAERLVLASR